MSYLFILGAAPYCDVLAQQATRTVITGRVMDIETREPLSDVNVYLSFTTIGTSTDITGAFTILNSPEGVFDLIFSRVGYERRIIHIKIVSGDSLNCETVLKPQVLKGAEVEVTAESPREWRENLARFQKAFNGETGNSSQCSIQNPEVLSFHFAKDTLVARADSVLRIDNDALGYRLYVVLKEFVWNTNMDYGHYLIYPFFQPKPARNGEEQDGWEENRKKTYEGSLKHFLHSLYSASAGAEMFTIFSGSFKKLARGQGHRVSPNEFSLEPMAGTPFKTMQFQNWLRVNYGIRHDVPSFITLRKSYALIDSLGNLFDPLSIEVSGKWAKSRIAELLPMH